MKGGVRTTKLFLITCVLTLLLSSAGFATPPEISITGQVELEAFLGTGTSPLHTRTITFVATGGASPATWNLTLTNTAGAVFDYTLTDVPEGTNGLSAKTAWSLRRKQSVTFDSNNQATVDFTGSSKLLGGDINNSNSVNIFDYALMKVNWGHGGVADINGDGDTNILDYTIMKSNWFKKGDAQ